MSDKLSLVLNCGSSSLKFVIINPLLEKRYLYGNVEYLGPNKISINWYDYLNNKKKIKHIIKISYKKTINFIFNNILKKNILFNKIKVIAHRIVHGGYEATKSSLIDNKIIKSIKSAILFAPLHNPSHLLGIYESMKICPHLSKKNVAVFDTSFHRTMPKKSYLYGLPYKLYKNYGIRRYGAHGISYQYIVYKTSKIFNKKISKLKIIACHLGNGSSVAAINNGKIIDTSMGLTPSEGLLMGTRSGDIDINIIFFLYECLGISIKNIKNLINKQSGILGLTENNNDFRYIESKYNKNKKSKIALDIFCHRLSKYIGGYITLIDKYLDAIVFTGGIGQNSALMRKLSIKNFSLLNIAIDNDFNNKIINNKIGFINKKNTLPILVLPTDEELMIAKEGINLV
ncbi:acetate/propionate family kinase [Candidatus Annandia pinicola]|uniref:acetate/propionate family kinase n=1 Tax=Candidatus Annandia pinicola TaxID=1345117 RepID=UPI001D02A29D|nr:acetate/propionate family kinase [Candidatus Annandia pinicola]UDG80300.1 Acetate kinase [Candidatus Annandia pinicola]